MLDQLFPPEWPTAAVAWYYGGAFFWLLTYVLIIRRIIKYKTVELPGIVIAGNVAWEIVGGFLIYKTGSDLAFGGTILLWAWRAGAIMDAYMLIAVYRFGKKQEIYAWMQKNYFLIITFAFLGAGAMTYTFYQSHYDLAMLYNSGIILNVVMSAWCIGLFMRLKDFDFSPTIAWTKALATSVCFTIFLYLAPVELLPQTGAELPNKWFPSVVAAVTVPLDLIFIVLVTKRRKARKAAAAA